MLRPTQASRYIVLIVSCRYICWCWEQIHGNCLLSIWCGILLSVLVGKAGNTSDTFISSVMPNWPTFMSDDFSWWNRTCSISQPILIMQRSDWSSALLIVSADKNEPMCHQKLANFLVSRQMFWSCLATLLDDKNRPNYHHLKGANMIVRLPASLCCAMCSK